ncbi:MAG: hypothetical protein PHG97_00295 [Candidatus Margulisbacteria bacterium]|nr:hypothetical protein [Candidatus Margulisiibacteriota bacterium]
MGGVRRKVSIKCDCGQIVAVGSVFCPFCQAKIQKKNAKITKKEEKKYQKSMRGKGRKRK